MSAVKTTEVEATRRVAAVLRLLSYHELMEMAGEIAIIIRSTKTFDSGDPADLAAVLALWAEIYS